MNFVHWKNNTYKNGEYKPDHSIALVKERIRNIAPTVAQAKFRDDLLSFCKEKGLIREGFKIRRTEQGIRSNIQAFITILKKNGLDDEFFARCAKQPAED